MATSQPPTMVVAPQILTSYPLDVKQRRQSAPAQSITREEQKQIQPQQPLPTGWFEIKDPSGRSMFINSATGQTSWERPIIPTLPPGWQELQTPEGAQVFIHLATGTLSYERPIFQQEPSQSIQPLQNCQTKGPQRMVVKRNITEPSKTNPESRPNAVRKPVPRSITAPVESSAAAKQGLDMAAAMRTVPGYQQAHMVHQLSENNNVTVLTKKLASDVAETSITAASLATRQAKIVGRTMLSPKRMTKFSKKMIVQTGAMSVKAGRACKVVMNEMVDAADGKGKYGQKKARQYVAYTADGSVNEAISSQILDTTQTSDTISHNATIQQRLPNASVNTSGVPVRKTMDQPLGPAVVVRKPLRKPIPQVINASVEAMAISQHHQITAAKVESIRAQQNVLQYTQDSQPAKSMSQLRIAAPSMKPSPMNLGAPQRSTNVNQVTAAMGSLTQPPSQPLIRPPTYQQAIQKHNAPLRQTAHAQAPVSSSSQLFNLVEGVGQLLINQPANKPAASGQRQIRPGGSGLPTHSAATASRSVMNGRAQKPQQRPQAPHANQHPSKQTQRPPTHPNGQQHPHQLHQVHQPEGTADTAQQLQHQSYTDDQASPGMSVADNSSQQQFDQQDALEQYQLQDSNAEDSTYSQQEQDQDVSQIQTPIDQMESDTQIAQQQQQQELQEQQYQGQQQQAQQQQSQQQQMQPALYDQGVASTFQDPNASNNSTYATNPDPNSSQSYLQPAYTVPPTNTNYNNSNINVTYQPQSYAYNDPNSPQTNIYTYPDTTSAAILSTAIVTETDNNDETIIYDEQETAYVINDPSNTNDEGDIAGYMSESDLYVDAAGNVVYQNYEAVVAVGDDGDVVNEEEYEYEYEYTYEGEPRQEEGGDVDVVYDDDDDDDGADNDLDVVIEEEDGVDEEVDDGDDVGDLEDY